MHTERTRSATTQPPLLSHHRPPPSPSNTTSSPAQYGDHPLPPLTWNASNVPVLDGFYMARVKGLSVQQAASLSGAPGGGVAGVTITNVRVEDVDLGKTKEGWACENVTGTSSAVFPHPCPQLGG